MRKSVFSGLFYPKDSSALKTLISSSFSIQNKFHKKTKAILAPHAGYMYCIKQLSEAYNALVNTKFKTAVIIGPSHRHYFKGVSVYSGTSYQIPFGEVSVNNKEVNELKRLNPIINTVNQAHAQEHSIEVHLPFLHFINPSVNIVPIITGHNNLKDLQSISNSILDVVDSESTVFIVSTDFSHFFSSDIAVKMDKLAIDLLCRQDITELYNQSIKKNIQMCGLDAAIIVWNILNKLGVRKVEHLSYSHSGQITKDNRSVVGYNSLCAYE